MVGIISALVPPLADWRFAVDGSLEARGSDALFTLTRASANGTYVDANSVIQTAAMNAARFHHDPSDGTARGLLIEHAHTNNALRSEEIDNGSWDTTDTTILANNATAPDGNTTADRATHDNNTAKVEQNTFDSAGAAQCWSFFVRKGEHQWQRLLLLNGANSFQGWYDLTNGVLGTSATAGTGVLINRFIEDWGTYWRLGLCGSGVTGASRCFTAMQTADGSSTENVDSPQHLWGGDNGADDVMTSYVATAGSTATRAKDICSGSLTIPAQGGLYLEARTALGGGTQTLWQMDDGTADERIRVERNASDEIRMIVTTGGADVADLDLGVVADDTDLKVAARWDTDDFAASRDGGAAVTDTGGDAPGGMDTVRAGMDHDSLNHWNSAIARGTIFQHKPPNGELVERST